MNTESGEKAVAKLKIFSRLKNQPVRTFYLYKGLNTIGRDPNVCDVWLTEDFICRVHMHIIVHDKFIFIQDEVKRPGENPTTFSISSTSSSSSTKHVMELNTWYPCTGKLRYKLAGLLTLVVRRLDEDEQEAAPRKGYITPEQQTAINNRTHMDVTFVGEGPTIHNTQLSAPSIGIPAYYNLNPSSRGSSYNSSSASAFMYEFEDDHIRARCDDSFEPTRRIEDLTQVVREVQYVREGSNVSSQSVFLPPAPTIPGVPADVTLPRPIIRGSLGYFNTTFSTLPDHILNNFSEYFKSTQTSSTSMNIHHEDTLVISDDDMDDLSQSIVIIPENQPTSPNVRSEADMAARRARKREARARYKERKQAKRKVTLPTQGS